ncbi:hypothetical protein A3K73_03505 [Candidatus Pacearchaeota archaeon RBG_13_36_9]|nr:MAG: hypothetical protein A3K73_03505 [Candidatus Pacearchaeota archaeon RBG_13_36_9]
MNKKLAEIFYEIADILEIKKVQWKPAAYRKAARSIENLGEDVKEIYETKGEKDLEEIPGVGEAIAKKIVEYIETGRVKHLEELKKTIPKGVVEMMAVPGIGAKRAMKLYNELGISSVKELEEAAKNHKIAGLESFKEKSEENIIEGIEFMKKRGKRILLGMALPIARKIISELKKREGVKEAIAGGSLRRMEETIGDIDILVVASDYGVVNFFTKMPIVKKVLAKGDTKSSVITKDDIQIDLRIVKPEAFGSALQYFTGNKDHNIKLRDIAIKKNMKLSEYGLFKGSRQIAGKTEEEVYNRLGMEYIEPELRTETGEIEAALKKKLPKLIGYEAIKGDLHTHTKLSDGKNSIDEMAAAAEKKGYKYLAITDHGGKTIQHLNERQLEQEIKEIEKISEKQDIEILKGVEVDIGADGSLSIKDSALEKMDVVIASVHSGFKFPETKQTGRLLKALDNKYVNILGHPTARLIQEREPIKLDLEKIYEKAKERGIALEINSSLDRLDLNSSKAREALEIGCKFAIGTDAHTIEQLNHMGLGVGTARRGWLRKEDIINAQSLNKLKKWLGR